MKHTTFLSIGAIFLAVIFLSGCTTFESEAKSNARIQQNIAEVNAAKNAKLELIRQNIEKEKAERKIKEEAAEKAAVDARERYIKSNPLLSADIKDAIRKGEVMRGMSQDDVIVSFGEPQRKNVSVGEWGKKEQWVYYDSRIYLYFQNGTLRSWQESKRN